MIKSFADTETEKVFRREFSRGLPAGIQSIARRKLVYLDEADCLQDLLAPPGNRLEVLRGGWEGKHCIRINDQWRLCFTWNQPHAYDVQIVDCH